MLCGELTEGDRELKYISSYWTWWVILQRLLILLIVIASK